MISTFPGSRTSRKMRFFSAVRDDSVTEAILTEGDRECEDGEELACGSEGLERVGVCCRRNLLSLRSESVSFSGQPCRVRCEQEEKEQCRFVADLPRVRTPRT